MNKELIDNYIQYYITVFNEKSKYQEFINMYNEHSILTHDNHTYQNQNLINLLAELYKYLIDINSLKISYMLNGDRRANILLTYTLVDLSNNIKNVSQFILLAYSNNKEYWIHSSLLNIN